MTTRLQIIGIFRSTNPTETMGIAFSQKALQTRNISILYFTALVWLINGLFCKVLNLVPRHQEIVARILGSGNAPTFTGLIGVAEIAMAIWILSRFRPILCAALQIFIILLMNMIEFFLAPDLLLFGRLNLLFAVLFVLLIFYNEFVLTRKIQAAT